MVSRIVLALIVGTSIFLVVRMLRTPSDSRPILKSGQTFASYDEFLSLFNIQATDCQYFQPVPNCSVSLGGHESGP